MNGGHYDVVKFLLGKDVNVDYKGISTLSSLYLFRHSELYTLAPHNQTPLIIIAMKRNWDIAKQLIEKGAKVNVSGMCIFQSYTLSKSHHIFQVGPMIKLFSCLQLEMEI